MTRGPFSKLVDAVRDDRGRVAVCGVGGGFGPLLLSALGRELGRPLIIVCSEPERAAELASGLRFFAERTGDKKASPPRVLLMQGPDTSPYHPITPNRLGEMRRLAALYRMAQGPMPEFVVASVDVLRLKTLPRAQLTAASEYVMVNEEIDRERLLGRLDAAGYARVPVVEDPGTYGVRGGILDVWSVLYDRPARIDLFGDLVESMRWFHPETQRSKGKLTELHIPPARQVILSPETLKRARMELRQQAGELGVPGQEVRAILAELDEGIAPLGLNGWLPAFYERLDGLVDYAPADALWCIEDPSHAEGQLAEQADEADTLFAEAIEKRRIAYEPAELFDESTPTAQLTLHNLVYEDELIGAHRINFEPEDHGGLAEALAAHRGEDHAFKPAADRVRGWLKRSLLPVVVGESSGHAERLRGLFSHYGLAAKTWTGGFSLDRLAELETESADVNVFVGDLERGFVFEPIGLALFGTADVLPHKRKVERRSRARAFAEATLQSFRDLSIGDLVVHTDHGIGRYGGLIKLEAGGAAGDYLKLQYHGDDLLYVPVHKLDRVQRYSQSGEGAPKLEKLGGVTWEKTKARAKKAAESIARELIDVEAARKSRFRDAYSPRDDYFEEFCAAFPYDETPDQAKAIDDVLGDMDKTQPMDRLVCGDVGYGKTEVAMRAAMRAVLDRKQVAVLVPTTVLAEQHRLTFEDRFRGYPVEVAALSRFRTKAEEKKILGELEKGRIDIVVGTHRLLSKDVKYRDLGLLVVDEEHRFGVKHKERIKQVKELVDVLTLTATPIPRTLNMAISGLRDMSIIATPPTDRLAVRTLVSRVHDDIIAEAIERELKRSGQVYVVHNRIEGIYRLAERIERLVPRARVLVGHGQMKQGELERVMLKFMAGEADVLVSTTIIESGLDIPRANTMLIHRADMLGLAQMYQLRGRVGRSDRRAWCYLLIPQPRALTGLAQKRVIAMQKFTELGSGFHIASMDLELRGAGNLLGKKQSGHAKDVGLELFCELLAEAVHTLKGQVLDPVEHVSCEMKVPIAAFLPEAYVPDVSLRLFFYKCIASSKTRPQLEEAFADLADRCGRPPEEATNLFDLTDLKVRAQRLGGRSFSYADKGMVLALDPVSPLGSIEAMLALLQRKNARWKLTPKGELVRAVSSKEWAAGLGAAREGLRELTRYALQRGLIPAIDDDD